MRDGLVGIDQRPSQGRGHRRTVKAAERNGCLQPHFRSRIPIARVDRGWPRRGGIGEIHHRDPTSTWIGVIEPCGDDLDITEGLEWPGRALVRLLL